jgi:putative flippase GtrA
MQPTIVSSFWRQNRRIWHVFAGSKCKPRYVLRRFRKGLGMQRIGRGLQLLALLVLPVLLLAFYNAPVRLFASLGFSVAIFSIGYFLQTYVAK